MKGKKKSNDVGHCTRCGDPLNPKTMVWLELSVSSGLYYKPEEFPDDEESQGGFEFGAACAKKTLINTKNGIETDTYL